ncbi:D-alanyl-D-alanine carboxypeptidase [Cucumibacter marinus]|uniref:D-alanyl-D-alanine carboxypeptidase n=1 Tax=Cucumibacter marinus TaxID=1121252 RepID=UPI000406D741|nr:D-alanyl-D-alanine carboxypeptidase [Cucumibacter marinus]
MRTQQASNRAGGLYSRVLVFVMIVLVALAAATPAQAQNLRKYAGIVVDAKTGKVLYSNAADSQRYPASVAKVMTLYILFQEIDAGRMSLSTPLKVSQHAANAQPSKLYLKPGSTIAAKDAILALVTKSANDVARVVAENISGSESAFAERMTSTAKALGMNRTVYRNASGLPDSRQVTTVRDQARLATAIYQHFPKYYEYFQTRSFKYKGQTYGNHNRLLGRNGVDGIKTGYINAAGFNLMTAARKDGRHIVVIAFGFNSGGSRDAKVAELVNAYLPKARKGDYWRQAQIPRPGGAGISNANPIQVALASPPPQRPAHLGGGQTFAPAPAPLEPVLLDQGTDNIRVASVNGQIPVPPARPTMLIQETPPALAEVNRIAAPEPAKRPVSLEPVEAGGGNLTALRPVNVIGDLINRVIGRDDTSASNNGVPVPPAAVGNDHTSAFIPPQSAPMLPDGSWAVQVGAAPSEDGANRLLTDVSSKYGALRDYRPYVEITSRDGQTFFRARYVGFAGRDEASAVCRALKERDINCLAMPG